MKQETIFDSPVAYSFMDARRSFLAERLPQISPPPLYGKTALDCGGGVGYFAAFLAEIGFEVTSFDARADNIEIAKQRHPQIEFRVGNLEDPTIRDYGAFDLVLCLGLLYHLENPMIALRNLRSLTGDMAVIESVVVPRRSTTLHLLDEVRLEDQGVNYVAFNPSESCLVKMLYAAEFGNVYRFIPLPDHWEFKTTAFRRRGRAFLLASDRAVAEPFLKRVDEPTGLGNPWVTPLGKARHRIGTWRAQRSHR